MSSPVLASVADINTYRSTVDTVDTALAVESITVADLIVDLTETLLATPVDANLCEITATRLNELGVTLLAGNMVLATTIADRVSAAVYAVETVTPDAETSGAAIITTAVCDSVLDLLGLNVYQSMTTALTTPRSSDHGPQQREHHP